MKRVRAMLAHSPAIAISMLALVFALGSGAGYAASTATSKPQLTIEHSIFFHQLKVHRGWHGSLWYAENDGVIYLAGSVGSTETTPPILTTLPRSISRFALLNVPVTFGVEGDGFIQLLPGGRIQPITPKGGDYKFVSLDGVSFAADAP